MSGDILTKYDAALVATPASASILARFYDLDGVLKTKNSTGFLSSYQKNASSAAQTPAASTRTYLVGTKIALAAAGRLQVLSAFRWRFDMVKTGAGAAGSTIDVAIGAAGTTADAALLAFAKPAGSAVIDTGYVQIDAVMRSIGAGSTAVISGTIEVGHTLATTGHMLQQQFVATLDSAGFNSTTAAFLGVCITTGALDAITIKNVITEAWDV